MAIKPTYEELEENVRELEKRSNQQIRIKNKLQEQNEAIKALMNANRENALLVDTEGMILAINEKAAQRHGKTPEELTGTLVFELFPAEVALSRKAEHEKVVLARMPVSFQDEQDGRFFENNLYPVHDPQGNVVAIAVNARDVTESKKAEEALRESEELFKAIFNNAGIGIGIADRDRRFRMLNNRMAQIFGMTVDELLGSSPLEFSHPDDMESSRNHFEALLEGKISHYRLEKRYIRKDGSIFWADVSVSPITDKDGSVKASIATIVDMTKRKEAEEASKKEAIERRILVDQSRDGIVVIDQNGKVYEANRRYCEMLGYTAEEVLQLYLWDWDDQWDKEQLLEMVRTVDETGDHFETRHRRKDGTYIDVEISTNGAVIEGEKRVFCVCRDITERKRVEKALKEANNIINRSPAVTFLWKNLEGWPVEFVSDNVKELFGYTAEELTSEKFTYAEIIHPGDLERVREEVERYSKEIGIKEFTHKPYMIIRKDGEVRWVDDMTLIRRDEEGNLTHFEGLVLDISDRVKAEKEKKRVETRLQQAQKMEAIGTLAGGVAHDLNNILSGIVSYPELLLMDLPEESPLKKPILTIKRSGERAAVIVQDLLTLARRGVAISEIVYLNHIISEQLKSPEYENLKLFHPDLQVTTRFEKELLHIKGSSTHLSKTMMNLLSNAAEAMPGGGRISISTENRYVDRPVKGYDDVEEGDYVAVTISDSGVGISKEDMESIFEPFYTKKVMGRSGTGLGMSVVWGTVKDHKGYIEVKSDEGRGTTFTLYFPVTREEIVTDESRPVIEEYMGHGEAVLVVDDIEEQRELASIMLQKLGYSVNTASSGEEAVEYLKKHHADLLVLDMIMDSGMDGLDTYKRIIEFRPDQKAIIASGFSETERVKELQRMGGGEYIKKPYTLEKIGMAVKKELRKRDGRSHVRKGGRP